MTKSFIYLTLFSLLFSCGKIVDRHKKNPKLTTVKKDGLETEDKGKTGDGGPGDTDGNNPGDGNNGNPNQVPPSKNDPGTGNGSKTSLSIQNIPPNISFGNDHDVHINRVTCEVFQKKGEWVLIEKLKNCDEFVIKEIDDPKNVTNPERNTLYWVKDKAQGYRRDSTDPKKLILVLDGSKLMGEIKVVKKNNKKDIEDIPTKDKMTIYIDNEKNDGYIFKNNALYQVFKNRRGNLNVVWSGDTAPNDAIADFGNVGDVYLMIPKDDPNPIIDYYRKQKDGRWERSCEGGAFGFWCGEVPPSEKNGGKFGKDKDLYRQSNGDIYQKTNKTWLKIFPRKFEYSLIQIPFEEIEAPKADHFYINTVTLEGYLNEETVYLGGDINRIHRGNYTPTNVKPRRAKEGDFYFHEVEKNYYKFDKDNQNRWTLVCVLNHEGYLCGDEAPLNTLGENGDIYLQFDVNKNVWKKVEGEWKKLSLDSEVRKIYIDKPETLEKLKNAENTIVSLTAQIQQHELTIDNLRKKLEEAKKNTPEDQSEKVKTLENQINTLQSEKDALQAEVDKLNQRPKQDDLDQLKAQIDQLEADKKDLQKKIDELSNQTKPPVIVDDSQVNELKEDITRLNNTIDSKNQEINTLKQQIQNAPDCDCDDLKRQIEGLNSKIESLEKQLEAANTNNSEEQIKRLQEQLAKEERDHAETKRLLESKKQEIEQLQRELDQEKENNASLVEVNETLTNEINTLKEEIINYQTILKDCEVAGAEADASAQDKYDCSKYKDALEELEKLKAQLDVYKEMVSHCKNTYNDLKYNTVDCEELKNKYEDLIKKIEDNISKKYTDEDLQKRFEEGKKSQEGKITDLENQVQRKNDKINELEEDLRNQPKVSMHKKCEITSIGVKEAVDDYKLPPLPYEATRFYDGYLPNKALFEAQGNTSTKVSSTGEGHAYVANSHVIVGFNLKRGAENCGWVPSDVSVNSSQLIIEYSLIKGNRINHKDRPSEFICFYHNDLSYGHYPCSGKEMEDSDFPTSLSRAYKRHNTDFNDLLDTWYSGSGIDSRKLELETVDYFPVNALSEMHELDGEISWFIFTDDIKLNSSPKIILERD